MLSALGARAYRSENAKLRGMCEDLIFKNKLSPVQNTNIRLTAYNSVLIF